MKLLLISILSLSILSCEKPERQVIASAEMYVFACKRLNDGKYETWIGSEDMPSWTFTSWRKYSVNDRVDLTVIDKLTPEKP